MRRGVTGTAVAAVAMAALTASQAPGLSAHGSGADGVSPPPGPPISGGTPFNPDLPPLVTPGDPGASSDLPGSPGGSGTSAPGNASVPASLLTAYQKAERTLAHSHPGCHLRWELLAAIGQVESGQARGGNVNSHGTTLSPILGPQLNGNGFANITDTDHGVYDGDSLHDRAVGPMQFIPSTWATWGTDGNDDGVSDPNNIYDAALAAGNYLCADGRDLSNPRDLDRAILGYNHSQEYLRTVKSWFEYFKTGSHTVPDSPGGSPSAGSPGGGSPGSGSGGGSTADKDKPAHPKPTASASGSVDQPTPHPGGDGPGSNPGGGPSPGPSPRPSPGPSQEPTEGPSPSPSPSCPTPSPSPTTGPSPSPSPSPGSAEPGGASPSPSADGDPCASPSPSPSPTASPTAQPSAAPSATG